MDTFMDKLAQKLTAQEMIRANRAADAEEMDRLKKQVNEYSECLEQLQKMIDVGMAKLESARVDSGEINRLVEEGIARFENAKVDSSEINRLVEEGIARFENAKVDGSEINRLVEEGIAKFESIKVDGSEINRLVEDGLAKLDAARVDGDMIGRRIAVQLEDSIAKMNEAQDNAEIIELLENLKKQIEEKLAANDENVHKECVKVYRNVQAVVQEESNKTVDVVCGKISKLRKSVNIIMGVTIAALIFSLASVVLQIAQMFYF